VRFRYRRKEEEEEKYRKIQKKRKYVRAMHMRINYYFILILA